MPVVWIFVIRIILYARIFFYLILQSKKSFALIEAKLFFVITFDRLTLFAEVRETE